MLVKVIPVRPIPGILPKNKWIDTEMVLDLNKNEIVHCMQFGNVYDEDRKLIDAISVHKADFGKPKAKPVEVVKPVEVEPVIVKDVPTVTMSEPVKEEKSVEEPIIEVHPINPIVETTLENVENPVVCFLEQVSCVKEDNYIILTTQMNTNSKLEGNLYGLFNVTSGTRPVIEYKLNDQWIKINNKFANFNKIESGDKFVFRFLPKNENEFSYKIVIKEANEVLTKLEEKINPVNL